MVEGTFFLLGVLPYWYCLSLSGKTKTYWLVMLYCCGVWIVYFAARGQWAPLINNIVETMIVARGLWILRSREKENVV